MEDFFKLSESELEDLYKKFRMASDGEKSLSRRKFSDIMHRCFPRTHKVRTLQCMVYFWGLVLGGLGLGRGLDNFILQSDLEDFVFKLYDFNEDGKIVFLEFMMMMTIVNEGSINQKVTQIFR